MMLIAFTPLQAFIVGLLFGYVLGFGLCELLHRRDARLKP